MPPRPDAATIGGPLTAGGSDAYNVRSGKRFRGWRWGEVDRAKCTVSIEFASVRLVLDRRNEMSGRGYARGPRISPTTLPRSGGATNSTCEWSSAFRFASPMNVTWMIVATAITPSPASKTGLS